jgi:hypothetical protein
VHIRHCYTFLHWQKFTGCNRPESKFWSPECAKSHLRASAILKFFLGVIPPDPRYKGKGKREGRKGLAGERGKGKEIEGGRGRRGMGKRGGEGRGGEGKGKACIDPPRFHKF